jgi:dihydrofolate synthase/folylpolyglutamate synthase
MKPMDMEAAHRALDYKQARSWLASWLNSEQKPRTQLVDFHLERMQALLALLGDPQHGLKSVVIAGTNGKGSTSAMLSQIAQTAGLRVGMYTSPHLHSIRERIQINGQAIKQAELARTVARVQPAVAGLPSDLGELSQYEILTAMAFWYFADQQVELAVLEIGLGGRLDAVNLAEATLAVLSTISYDHTALLGTTLSQIASEKAGIIKGPHPVVSIAQDPEAAAVIESVVAQQQAQLFIAQESGLLSPNGELLSYPSTISAEKLGLKGSFQLSNARLASAAALVLQQTGWPISNDAIATGLANSTWPARFEVLHNQRCPVIIDGAHNESAMQQLRQSLLANYPDRRIIFVIGSSADKDLDRMMATIMPLAYSTILTRADQARAADPEQLYQYARLYTQYKLIVEPNLPKAVEQALDLATPNDLICICGSLFVAAAARHYFGLAEPD